MHVPRDVARRELAESERRIEHEPEEVLGDPEQQYAAEHARFAAPGPVAEEYKWKMEKKRNAREHPGVVARHLPPAPEEIEHPIRRDAPGRQIRRPSGCAFDLDLDVGQEIRDEQHADDGRQQQPAETSRVGHARGFSACASTTSSTARAACGRASARVRARMAARRSGDSSSSPTRYSRPTGSTALSAAPCSSK